jgi:hypothetical protein
VIATSAKVTTVAVGVLLANNGSGGNTVSFDDLAITY